VLAAIDPLHRHAEPSGLDRAVLAAARELGHAFGMPWRVVHAFPDPESFSIVSSVEVSPGIFYGTENVESVHRVAVHALVSEYGVTPDRIDLRPGEPAEVIAEVVRKRRIELVVLGAIKRSALAQALLGSTAERVVAEVDCDVLLVPPPAPAI
jgi:universal stress protein E